MTSFDKFKTYLPKYLSPNSEQKLFEDLKQFPIIDDPSLYTSYRSSDETVYQGDGIKDMLVINLPEDEIKKVACMIISNTCDINLLNKGLAGSRICYCPIVRLSKYKALLLKEWSGDKNRLTSHIQTLQNQQISQIFYLPKTKLLAEDSFVFFDRINTCSNDFLDRKTLKDVRIFTLSNLGIYLFLFKLSVHFTRLNETIDRDAP